jgi:hypothetical protein
MGVSHCPLGRQCSPGLRANLPADGTGFGSSSSLARNFEWRLPLIALAQLGAYALLTHWWTSWRTCDRRKSDWRLGLSRMLLPHFAPCQQDVKRTFLCVHYYRARIPDGTSMQDFDALVRCAATADVLRTGLHVRVSRVRRRNQARACCCTAQRSKVESLRALHQYTNVQRRSALHAAPATLVARPARVDSLHSSSHCGRCERRNQFASGYAGLRLQLGLRRSSCCACSHATAMEDARKPSQRLGQRL